MQKYVNFINIDLKRSILNGGLKWGIVEKIWKIKLKMIDGI